MDDDEWESYRKEAREWASQRDLYFTHASDAFENGDGEMAKYYSNLGKECRKLMEDANSSAAYIIFEINNEDLDDDEVDLHGLFVSEAIAKLTQCIDHARRNDIDELTVIVGQGNNSESGSKLKPAVTEFATVNRIPYEFSRSNAGRIRLKLQHYNRIYRTEPSKYPQSKKVTKPQPKQQQSNNVPPTIPSPAIPHIDYSQYSFVNTTANESGNGPDSWFFVWAGLVILGALKLFGWL